MIQRILLLVIALLLSATVYAEPKRTEVPIGGSPSRGPADAPVTVIEFIDFQ